MAARYVDRFGAANVYGRAMTTREMQDITTAEALQSAYQDMKQAESWTAWAEDNPERDKFLKRAMRAAHHG